MMLHRPELIAPARGARDAGERFLHSIARRANLPPHVSVRSALVAATGVLLDTLGAERARHVAGALPAPARQWLDLVVRDRDGRRPIPLDRAEALQRVADQLDIDLHAAETVCKAVYAAMRIQLRANVILEVSRELPPDLEILWLSMPPPVTEVGMHTEIQWQGPTSQPRSRH